MIIPSLGDRLARWHVSLLWGISVYQCIYKCGCFGAAKFTGGATGKEKHIGTAWVTTVLFPKTQTREITFVRQGWGVKLVKLLSDSIVVVVENVSVWCRLCWRMGTVKSRIVKVSWSDTEMETSTWPEPTSSPFNPSHLIPSVDVRKGPDSNDFVWIGRCPSLHLNWMWLIREFRKPYKLANCNIANSWYMLRVH